MQAALVVLDGWGLGDHDRLDAVREADTPTMDDLTDRGASGTLDTSGRAVGLPAGQMGNSEVGHLTIGAGRVIDQSYTRITRAVENGELSGNDAIEEAFGHAAANDGRVHLMGLVSDGGVHSDQRHLHALIEIAAERGVEAVTHAFTDGRDTPPKSAVEYLTDLEGVIERCGTGDVATVSGRYYAMDRDENWARTKRSYDAIVEREADHTAPTAVEAVEESYERGDTDEFVEPTLIEGAAQRMVRDGDSVLFFNFRADRARQLVRMLTDIRPEWGDGTTPPKIELVTLTEYDETFSFPVAFAPHEPADTLGEVLAAHGKTQLRIAESEKYPHVTYFLNGGREVEFDGERREIVASPDVPTYDQQPSMSAVEVTDTAIGVIEAEDPDVLVLNYANADMVGHTGDFTAAVEAVETVDTQLARLVEICHEAGADVLVTADHGNADDMGTPDDPDTTHTKNPVPIVFLAADGSDGGKHIRDGGELSDLAPTVLERCGIEVPAAMTGRSLLD
ncbi:2,3-bisphosphoglycerate-independent phosphoglycerate mutase [Halococcus dombrowskii]|uniref:2,3-bisphosphoglycerate-independent phosphoglycerate mutase n=1 Tax=Halococcus dombrowskii TaxID=179637 RepID=A0AAX3AL01_HALDO|nr:2,3-bisphosphoglycerate-independent phosphoglycerate mutase [Halococcus dombrowskii]UOO94833.1 2,3-bisphosphoglycerate-independent phosphoglycerate mutase [Halococcus dombrowskii]